MRSMKRMLSGPRRRVSSLAHDLREAREENVAPLVGPGLLRPRQLVDTGDAAPEAKPATVGRHAAELTVIVLKTVSRSD